MNEDQNNSSTMSDDEYYHTSSTFGKLPHFKILAHKESFLISSAKSEHYSANEYRSLALQRLRMLTSTFSRDQKQVYHLPSKELLIILWRNILQCFRDQIESKRMYFNSSDFDIIDLIQFLKDCTWIFIEIPIIRRELYFGFDLKIEQSPNYNSRDESKLFHIYPGDKNQKFVCTFLFSHILRNMEFDMARYLLDYFSNLFFEEFLFSIENDYSELSLLLYEKKYESENHLMKYINEYIELLHETYDDFDIVMLNNIKCISKLIASLYHCSGRNGRRFEYRLIMYTRDRKDYINIKLKFRLLEYFFVPCIDESSSCKLMNIVFSPYLNLSVTSPESFKDFFKIVVEKLERTKVQNHSNSGGMTLVCLYFLLHLSNSEYSHLASTIEPLVLSAEHFSCCQNYVTFLRKHDKGNNESIQFCNFILALIERFQIKFNK